MHSFLCHNLWWTYSNKTYFLHHIIYDLYTHMGGCPVQEKNPIKTVIFILKKSRPNKCSDKISIFQCGRWGWEFAILINGPYERVPDNGVIISQQSITFTGGMQSVEDEIKTDWSHIERCHDMENLSALQALCENPPVTNAFPSQRDNNIMLWYCFSSLKTLLNRPSSYLLFEILWCSSIINLLGCVVVPTIYDNFRYQLMARL